MTLRFFEELSEEELAKDPSGNPHVCTDAKWLGSLTLLSCGKTWAPVLIESPYAQACVVSCHPRQENGFAQPRITNEKKKEEIFRGAPRDDAPSKNFESRD